ncbi:MAG: amino acid adenylation domain-containing protein [Crocinitomix sp.]|nr:amino acid adenylation domain-containing protein [Crocinitomix sp.]
MAKLINILSNCKAKGVSVALDKLGTNLSLKGNVASLTDEDKKELIGHKAELIEFFHQQKAAKNIIPNIALSEHGYALSSNQNSLWLLGQFIEGNKAYNMPSVRELKGDYDVISFQKAIDAVIERHEILRTVFRSENGQPKQKILSTDENKFAIEFIDLSNKAEKKELLQQYIIDHTFNAFDLENGPLLRAALLKLEEDEFVFFYNMHHIISDGWSMDILARDVLSFYEAFKTGNNPVLPELRIQYKDYSEWQMNKLKAEKFKAQKSYWLQELSNGVSTIDLPSNTERPTIKTYNGQNLETYLSKESNQLIKSYVAQNGGTMFTGLLACWNVLLHHYTGEKEIVVGTPVSGRNHFDLQEQIGFYVNTLVLKNSVDENQSFNSFFNEIKSKTLTSFSNQDYPFDQLVEDLNLERDLSRSPLFDIMFSYRNIEQSANQLSTDEELIGNIRSNGFAPAKFDLDITFQENEEQLYFGVTYNEDVYDKIRIEQLMRHFDQLIKSVLKSPNSRIGEIYFSSLNERNELLIERNNTAVLYPEKESLTSVFEKQVNDTPDHVALVFDDLVLTYKQLNEQANQVANYLLEKEQIQANDFVGVQIERSEWMIISVLAILKTGATYVPIDPEYPEDRISFIQKDTGMKTCIDEKTLENIKAEYTTCASENISSKRTEESLLYVMYTSGSTGKPKGVKVTDKGAVRLVKSTNFVKLTDKDTLLATGAFPFDASTFEYWGMLLNGGKLILAKKTTLLDNEQFAQVLVKNQVSIMFLTPAWLNQLIDDDVTIFSTLKWIVCGGDIMSPSHINKLHKAYPNLHIVNGYGPTENTTFSLTYEINETVTNKSIPIGKPINNSTCYILNESHQLVPDGVIGEICLGGDGLAKGYLNLPELTDSVFIDHPFVEGEKIYKTGDLGKWLPDGNIAFTGRKDFQVKIRGHRIELGEVEFALSNNSDIKEAKVIVSTIGDEKQIVAYYVTDQEILVADIVADLKKRLPSYMLPSFFINLDKLPLTSNGKIDKEALPKPTHQDNFVQTFTLPNSPLEKQVAEIWKRVLNQEEIGLESNFFEIGGHSLKATRLIAAYSKEFGVKIGIEAIFESPDFLGHVNLINSKESRPVELIEKLADGMEFYLASDAQKRLWVLDKFEEASGIYNMPFQIELDNQYNLNVLEEAIQKTVERHEILRTVFKEVSGELVQIVQAFEEIKVEIVKKDFSAKKSPINAVENHIAKDAYLTFDLEKGPLFRACLFDLAENHHVLYFNMHHIISDGWSMEILYRDVMANYEALIKGERPNLPKLEIQYKDYAAWQQKQNSSELFEKCRTYWKSIFKDSLSIIDLPSDNSRPVFKTYNGANLGKHLTEELTGNINAFSKENDVTLFMSLLASWNVLLYRYTSENNLIIGTPVAGRSHADLEDQIGFYVNTLALKNTVEADQSFKSHLAAVKKNTLGAFEHFMYPFDRLVEDVNLVRDTGRSAIFDIMLTLQNLEENSAEEVTYSEEISKGGNPPAKFDLDITFQENGQQIFFQITYNTDVYSEELIKNLMLKYETLLAQLLAEPNKTVDTYNLLTPAESNSQLIDFNDTKVKHPFQDTILALFAEYAWSENEKTALIFNDKKQSFSELDQFTQLFASYLISKCDIKNGDRIGVKVDRNEKMIGVIIGVLRAGAVYVPIDKEYPQDRIEFIEKDSECKFCITDDFLEKFAALSETIQLSDKIDKAEAESLAYVIYTSGSTGIPKGVPIQHNSLVDYVQTANNRFGLKTNDIQLQQASISFDVSVEEIFTALCFGRTLVIAEQGAKDIDKLITTINQHQVSFLSTTPLVINELNDRSSEFKSLKVMVSGGDELKASHIDKLFGTVKIFNTYGPTEATVCATYYEIKEKEASNIIGKAIANRSVYILNEALQPMPIGVVGQIYIGGIGLTKGYLNRPDLTNEKFIDSPFSNEGKLYATGDMGRYLPSGDIVFAGRKDEQVKIRGYRVELGEIEAKLMEFDEISEVLVLTFEMDGEKELAAYFVSNKPLERGVLRGDLKEKLPYYMVPSYFIPMDKFPLTSNDKVNKKELPNPIENALTDDLEIVLPKTETQKAIAQIWIKILKRDEISIKDDFFEIGGHSLKATRLISECFETFGVKLQLNEVFKNATILKLALLIEAADKNENNKIEAALAKEFYPITHGQYGIWLQHQFDPESIAFNMPFEVELDKGVAIDKLEKALLATIDRHEILRTVFVEHDEGEIGQKIITTEHCGFNVVILDHSNKSNPEDAFKNAVLEDSLVPFDLQNAPLIRATIHIISNTHYVLSGNMHHIISDGWSMNVLKADVFNFYQSFTEKDQSELAPLVIQYKDYATWQTQQLNTPEAKDAGIYWRNLFSELPSRLSLPSKNKRPLKKTSNGELLSMWIPEATVEQMKQYTHAKGGTLFMGLLASWNVLLYRYTGEKDITLGTPIAGRTHKSLENQIGFYLGTLALRNTVDENELFSEFFSRIIETTIAAFDKQIYPFELLIEELDGAKDISRSPIFDVLLTLQNTDDNEDIIVPEDVDYNVVIDQGDFPAKFDLDLKFSEVGKDLLLNVSFNNDVYEREMIESLLMHFSRLTSQMFMNENQKVGEIDFISSEEKEQLTVTFNKTESEYNSELSLVDLFENQVKVNPQGTSVKYKGIAMTYAELDEKANLYANYLIEVRGVRPGDRVVVVLPHTHDLMVVLLGIMKANAIYVPIDPKNPIERQKHIGQDSKSVLTIDQEEKFNIEKWENLQSGKVIAPERKENNEISFIIYTSGSTGKSKGTLLKTSGVINRLNWMWNNYSFVEGDVCCAKTSISFVDHIWEFFGPLLKGVPLVFIDKEQVLNIPEFIVTLGKEKVTRMVLVPTLLRAMLDYPELCVSELTELNFWVSSGEALKEKLVLQFYETFRRNSVRLLNVYGSTEVTADATYFDTYEKYNSFKSFQLFETTIENQVDSLIKWYDRGHKVPFNSIDDLIQDGNFNSISTKAAGSLEDYTEFLNNELVPNVVNVSAPSFIGHMTGPVPKIFRELGGLVNVLNQNQVKVETSLAATLVEKQVIGIFHNIAYQQDQEYYEKNVQNPNIGLGVVTNGGTMSNLMALSYILNNELKPKDDFKGVAEEGLVKALNFYGYDRVALIGTDWCHYSFGKALKILGLGKEAFVEMDFEGKASEVIKVELTKKIRELRDENVLILGIVGVAGTTESGHIEPLTAIGETANAEKVHFHVDAAFGGSYLMDDGLRKKLKGLELSNSVSICAHKQFYLPIGLSICLFRDPELVKISENNTHYQAREGSYDLGKYTIEGSKNFMSLLLHGAFYMFGKEGFAEVVRKNYETAQKFATLIEENSAFQLLFKPEMNIVLYRYIPYALRSKTKFTDEEVESINAVNVKLQTQLFAGGDSFVSHTKIKRQGSNVRHAMLRSVLMNPYTAEHDLIKALEEQERIAAEIEGVAYPNGGVEFKGNVPIGRPLENVKVYILDNSLNVVPIGVIGEICVAGDCVSAGYTSSFENATEQQFIQNPFNPEERLFKTGDLGTWKQEGVIEFKGRKDDQIKIRGNRLSLGEIKTNVLSYPKITEVIPRLEDDQIVVYLTAEEKPEISELRNFLKKKLPDYMMPGKYILIDEIPLTSSGKIDKMKLPQLENIEVLNNRVYVAPAGELQVRLVKIWEAVLGESKIGIEDDFFELGGHSLKAIKMINQLEKEFQVKFEVRNLMENPSIKNLAEEVERIQWFSQEENPSVSKQNIIEI